MVELTETTMMDDLFDDISDEEGARLVRYITGRSTAREAEEVREWIAAEPGRADLVATLRATWKEAATPSPEWDVDAAFDDLRRRRAVQRSLPQPAPDPWLTRPKRGRATRWLAHAAAIAAVLGGAAVWQTWPEEELAGGPRAVEMHEYATGRAERGEVRLGDGTRVVLNVDSRLRVPKDYGRDSRTVYLDGEALFEVEYDERRPFRVYASSVVAEDLGTVFGVRAYPDASPVTVVVAEGIVEVSVASPVGPAEPYRLDPGDLARVEVDGTVGIDRGIDAADFLAFADAWLVIRDTPLRDVAAQLGRWYDLDVRIADSTIAALPLTARFQNEPIGNVLDLIALSLDLHYEREGDTVDFHR